MLSNVLLLILMIYCSITDDFYLQGMLAYFKQRIWWKKNHPDSIYRFDYITSLIVHSFSWTVSFHIPVILLVFFTKNYMNLWIFVITFIINIIVHALVDNLKANALKLSLTQDQLIRISQVIITWLIYIKIGGI